MHYSEISSLRNVFLEDSFVLDIHEYPDRLVFDLDAVLAETHPAFEPPAAGSRYCFRLSTLSFMQIMSVEWISRTSIQFSDASGERDFGNIDSFSLEGDVSKLTGDWGVVVIKCQLVDFSIVKKK